MAREKNAGLPLEEMLSPFCYLHYSSFKVESSWRVNERYLTSEQTLFSCSDYILIFEILIMFLHDVYRKSTMFGSCLSTDKLTLYSYVQVTSEFMGKHSSLRNTT